MYLLSGASLRLHVQIGLPGTSNSNLITEATIAVRETKHFIFISLVAGALSAN